ncbi:MAG: succinate dehydrogenase cytochrome b subunit [Candidatus Binatia bacterium]|nr:succinate dehydrogenase cytochrome b subunit [Candidatus Binatia bacterium]
MSTPRFHIWSSVGKKLLTGLTGLALMGFIVTHLLGNLNLFVGSEAFNGYTETLHQLGGLLVVAEFGLAALFLLHAISAIQVWRDKKKARSIQNSVVASKGAPSKQTVYSRTMIVTGSVLLAFVVLHVAQFRFGIFGGLDYTTTIDGKEVRDLYRLVAETFKNPLWVGGYVAVMVLLGSHLRHGFWSAFQSVGLLDPRLRPLAYSAGAVFAVVMAVGFLVMPIYLLLFATVTS